MENECEALPGVAYPGFRDNRSTLNTKTGYDDDDEYAFSPSTISLVLDKYTFNPSKKLSFVITSSSLLLLPNHLHVGVPRANQLKNALEITSITITNSKGIRPEP